MKFGILIDGTDEIPYWQYECINGLLADGHQLEYVGVNANAKKQGVIEKFKKYPYRNFLFRAWLRFGLKIEARRSVSIENLIGSIQPDLIKTRQTKYSDYFSNSTIAKIKGHQLDFILRFSFGILRGEILNAAKYGVWSFHHDDNKVIRGGPAGFWEIYKGLSKNGMILQRLNEKLDEGEVLYFADVPTVKHSYKEHWNNLLMQSVDFPKLYVRRLQNGTHKNIGTANEPTPLYKFPSNLQTIGFLFFLLKNRLAFYWNTYFLIEIWAIAINKKIDFINGIDTAEDHWQWMEHPVRSKYLADPFPIEINNKPFILAEEYCYKKGKGHIVCIDPEKPNELQVVLEKDYHLSYPYSFLYKDEWYCIPESYGANRLDLFKLNPKTRSLEFVKTLLDSVAAIDASIVFYKEKWWIFYSIPELPVSSLCIAYSDDLLSDDWVQHPLNPVVISPEEARSGGNLFIKDNQLYRFVQRCVPEYGSAIRLMKINVLNESDFTQELVYEQKAFSGTYKNGLHHFSSYKQQALIDGKKRRFTIYPLLKKLKFGL